MRLPSVAAIIPCFNTARFVGDAVRSALAQNYPRLEVVVVDDGSTDGLTDALRAFRDRIKLVIQPHQGLSAARNRGIRETEAELIALLDADDRWHPDKIRRQVAVLASRPECCLVYTARQLIDTTGGSVQEGATWYPLPLQPIQGDCLVELVRANPLMSSSVLFRRSVLGTVWFDERLAACEDWDLWLRLAEQHHFAYIDERLTDIRVHDRNMTLDTSQMYESAMEVLELVVRRRQRRDAVTGARATLLFAAHREYEAGNISRARRLYRACMPALGKDGLRRFVVSLLPTPIRSLARAIWWGLHAKAPSESAPKYRDKSDSVGRYSPHLAVVEDDDVVRDLIVDVLADNGYAVDLAADGAEALRLCEQARYDLILSDLRMPNMDGAALYQELRLRYGSTMPRMMFVTAQSHSVDYARFLRATSVPVLAKPFTVDGLRTAVSRALAEGA
jgi:glycosyltransferase involved in cell wall biosynthesis/ActR/RegA family two-component response regulator